MRHRCLKSGFVFFLSLLLIPTVANAYIGPGLGAGIVGVVVGVLSAIGLALMAILWYPLKRFFKKKRVAKISHEKDPTQE